MTPLNDCRIGAALQTGAYQATSRRQIANRVLVVPSRVDSRLERGQPCPRVSGVQIKFARTTWPRSFSDFLESAPFAPPRMIAVISGCGSFRVCTCVEIMNSSRQPAAPTAFGVRQPPSPLPLSPRSAGSGSPSHRRAEAALSSPLCFDATSWSAAKARGLAYSDAWRRFQRFTERLRDFCLRLGTVSRPGQSGVAGAI